MGWPCDLWPPNRVSFSLSSGSSSSSVLVLLTSAFILVPAGPVTPLLSSSPITGTRSNIQATSGMGSGRNKTPSAGRPMSPPSSSSLIKSSTHHGNFTLCLPREYDVVVYRAQGGGNASEFIQVINYKPSHAVVVSPAPKTNPRQPPTLGCWLGSLISADVVKEAAPPSIPPFSRPISPHLAIVKVSG